MGCHPQSLGIQPEAGRAWAQQNARRLYHYPTIGEEYFPVQLTVVLAQRPGTDSDLHDRVRHEQRAHTRAIPERGPVGHRCIWRRSGRSALLQDQPGAPEPVSSRSEEHTSELQSLMRISYAVFCLKKKKTNKQSNLKNIH